MLQSLLNYCIFVYYYILMSGKLNKQEQVQVVIRLKPVAKDLINTRSVYVSNEQQKTLVVQTPNKKQYFVFDNIADDQCTQQEIYQHIGQDAVKSSTQGYNCCIFAYGQTGAGKSYSILGNSQDLMNDYYAQSRGILPRLLSDLFSWCSNETDRFWIKCSYLEIYNEQIIDLLNPDLKLRQIRQDFKKGVYVDGLSQENATTYQQAMNILMRGVKIRKTSVTSMNDQSSRSHTIFTLNIESQFKQEDNIKIRRSKINIVDLAGSQRAKQTKVQGQRLKQGCNINKSLHVLGNVINALVQSAKKKKHIPFRDSKLTHFLKDSLSGNSITKLLANIHSSKLYLGDTLSTLMFAKRAKILKMKVEVNQNMTQNFEQLRKEIRKLRQQLAQARYIKNQQKTERNASQSQNQILNFTKPFDVSNFDVMKNEQIMKVFEQNEINYKALIQIYEQHLKICSKQNKNKKNLNMHQEWKNLEKKNKSYRNLIKNIPAFTKIFKQNIQLKNQYKQSLDKSSTNNFKLIQNINISSLNKDQSILPHLHPKQLGQIKNQYETLLKEVQNKFSAYLTQLESAYEQLENQNKYKDQRIKELRKRKQLPPDLQQLTNENQYFKLNILQLEDQVNNLQQRQRKLLIEIKQLKKQRQNSSEHVDEEQSLSITSKLAEIKRLLQHQSKDFQQQRNSMLTHIEILKQKLISQMEENQKIIQNMEKIKLQNKGLKKKLNSLLKINNQIQIIKDQNNYTTTFWTNEESNFSQDLQIFKQQQKSKNQNLFEKQESRLKTQCQGIQLKSIDLSNQILKLHKSYSQQIAKLKDEIRNLERTRGTLTEQNYQILKKLKKLTLQIQNSQIKGQKKLRNSCLQLQQDQITLTHIKSTKKLQKIKEPKQLLQKLEILGIKNNSSSLNVGVKKNILHVCDQKDEKRKKSSK